MIQLTLLSSKINTGISELSTNARAKITTTMQAKRLLRGQWRPALMLGTVVSCLTVFWLFYYIDAKRLENVSKTTPWVIKWMECLVIHQAQYYSSDDTQTICSKQIESNLPSVPWFIAAESLLAILGIVVALVFISKPEFWTEWAVLLRNIFSRGKLGNGIQGQRSPGSVLSISPTKSPHQRQYSYSEPEIKKGTRMGYNDTPPDFSEAKSLPEHRGSKEQWVDMDALFDKEYDIQQGERLRTYNPGADLSRSASSVTDLHRTFSLESRMRAQSIQSAQSVHPDILPMADIPRYPLNGASDIQTGDILYKPPIQDYALEPPIVTNPTQVYLIANDNSDRYVDQPIVPCPVLRASSRGKRSQNPIEIPASPPQSPNFVPTTSLSPMPPRQPLSAYAPRTRAANQEGSVLIRDSDRGSPAIITARRPASKTSLEENFIETNQGNTHESTKPMVPQKSPARQYSSNITDE
ncbi:hypothetical protein FBU30_010980 [Linnemannia zychae]|nr:hypothetical protein FBU30_010980 [Linnemannia zychae]